MRVLLALPSLLALLSLAAALPACSDRSAGPPAAPPASRPTAREVLDASRPPAKGPPTVETPWRGAGAHVEVSVWEMHCQGCELEVEGAIGAVDGVAQVRADHESAVVRIELADAARREAVIPRIRDAIHANGRQVIGEDTLPPAGR